GRRPMRPGLAAPQATGAAAGRPYALASLAKAYGQDGQGDTGQQLLDEALALVHRTGERCYEAELYRLKGELLLQGRNRHQTVVAGEESLRQALAVARRQHARSLEFRSARSLGRL